MSEKENGTNQISISITPINLFVNFRISDAEGKLIKEFNLSPFDALSISTSLQDSAIIAKTEAMIQEHLNEHK